MSGVLYLSDLDGTLLGPDQRLSPYAVEALNRLVKEGLLFSYATARSFHTARVCTAGLTAHIPAATYNGSLIVDQRTGEILQKTVFSAAERDGLSRLLREAGLKPIVYSLIDGRERFSFDASALPRPEADFLAAKTGDVRIRPLQSEEGLLDGEVFYFTCIDAPEKIRAAVQKLPAFRQAASYVQQTDIYSGEEWLELMPAGATKRAAVRQLLALTGAEKAVVFGDMKNDIPMFLEAAEGYAVANAAPELKAVASGIIGSNREDGVVRWLERYGRRGTDPFK